MSMRSDSRGDGRGNAILRAVLLAVLVLWAVMYVAASVHWRLTSDAPIMHYVNFLIRHGMKPYSDSDNNMPGAYYTDAWAMGVFGTGDLGWRMYEFFLLAVMAGAMVGIARPYDWLAGVFAAGMFLVVHGAEGPAVAVEREQVILVLLVVAYGAMFTAVRRSAPWLMVVMGVACGVAASIKPTFLPLPVALLALMAIVQRRRGVAAWPYLVWAVAGLVAVVAYDVAYLVHYDALRGFWFILHTMTPAYAALQRLRFVELVQHMLPPGIGWMLLVSVAAVIAGWKQRKAWSWEQWALAMGVAFGLASFFVQGKGFAHHRDTYLALLLLLVAMELLALLRQSGCTRVIAMAAVGVFLVVVVPYNARAMLRFGTAGYEVADGMQQDLLLLGGSANLQDKVQCLDLVYGCFNALYHLGIVENTGFTGDLTFFSKTDGPAVRYYRSMFWELARKDPATVLVLSNEVFLQPDDFDKVKNWPEFADYVRLNYTQLLERTYYPGHDGYRIYVRNGTDVLSRAEALAPTLAVKKDGQR
jgi:hypothetical protein